MQRVQSARQRLFSHHQAERVGYLSLKTHNARAAKSLSVTMNKVPFIDPYGNTRPTALGNGQDGPHQTGNRALETFFPSPGLGPTFTRKARGIEFSSLGKRREEKGGRGKWGYRRCVKTLEGRLTVQNSLTHLVHL
jgi:hypothetical protein